MQPLLAGGRGAVNSSLTSPRHPIAMDKYCASLTTNREQLLGIQAARGVAALLVVAFHASMKLATPQYLGHAPIGGVFEFGHAGVDFFFVLSGFIITYIHGCDVGQPHRLGRYVWRRFSRIYPIYWLTIIVAVAVDQCAGRSVSPISLIESLTLISMGDHYTLPIAWTLEHEVLFYCAFGLAIYFRCAAKFLIAGCLLFVTSAYLYTKLRVVDVLLPSESWPWSFLGSPYHVQFLLGIAAARVVAKGNLRRPLLLALSGAALFAATATLDVTRLIGSWDRTAVTLYGLSSVLVIAGIAAAEQSRRFTCGRLAEIFGAMSYSLYLTHMFVLTAIANLCANLGLLGSAPDWLIVGGQIGASVLAALAIHLLIEKPLIRLTRWMAAPAQHSLVWWHVTR